MSTYTTSDTERRFQGSFEQYEDSLSAIETWKDGYGGNHVLDYWDLGDAAVDGTE